MTMGSVDDVRGFDSSEEDGYGALTPATFTAPSGDNHEIITVLYVLSSNTVQFFSSPAVPVEETAGWSLVIDGVEYPFSESRRTIFLNTYNFYWTPVPNPSWTDGQTVSLKLIERGRPFIWERVSEQTHTSYIDNEHAGGKTFVYRILAHNDRGAASGTTSGATGSGTARS